MLKGLLPKVLLRVAMAGGLSLNSWIALTWTSSLALTSMLTEFPCMTVSQTVPEGKIRQSLPFKVKPSQVGGVVSSGGGGADDGRGSDDGSGGGGSPNVTFLLCL